MRTEFTAAQLADPALDEANSILRKCVHCGFCNSTCPTFKLLGDELDGPRGRIYLLKNMLERDETPSRKIVSHIDRCLSCLSCMTTCPSSVNYMHLVDAGRGYIEEKIQAPAPGQAVPAPAGNDPAQSGPVPVAADILQAAGALQALAAQALS